MVRGIVMVYSMLFLQMQSVVVSLAMYMLGLEFCFTGLNKREFGTKAGLAKWTVSKLSSEKVASFFDKASESGIVISVMDGIALVVGLYAAKVGELVKVGPTQMLGAVLNLERNFCRVILLGVEVNVRDGDVVQAQRTLYKIGVNKNSLGRVFDPMGFPLDGFGPVEGAKDERLVEFKAPGIVDREPIYESLETGILAVDSLIPIGHGQRELIIGDRQTGKTSLAVDTIVNQGAAGFRNDVGLGTVCVYVSVGNKISEAGFILSLFRKHKALPYTIMVVAGAATSANLQFLAPYAGTAVAEWFMYNKYPALIVYDDLTKHAVAYRQLSLLSRRPPGREAFPGDIFFLHSRLLERSAKLSEVKHGGGSLTALPIVETQAGDVSAYIPTNVISITDGQIFLEAEVFARGIRPAINFGLSVSRVGSAAQCKAMKSVAGNLKLQLAQFRDTAKFAAFAADLDDVTLQELHRGYCLVELLKQRLFDSVSMKAQVILIIAGVQGHLDHVAVWDVQKLRRGIMRSVNIFKDWLDHFELDEPVEGNTLNFFIDYNIMGHTSTGESLRWRRTLDWEYSGFCI